MTKMYRVIVSGLRMRYNPGLDSKIIGHLTLGDAVYAERHYAEKDGYKWLYIKNPDGVYCWAAAESIDSGGVKYMVESDIDETFIMAQDAPRHPSASFNKGGLTINSSTKKTHIGFNVRPLIHFGDPHVLPHVPSSDTMARYIQTMAMMKARLVRIYAPGTGDANLDADRLSGTLDWIRKAGMLAIIVLSDHIGVSGHAHPGDEEYRTEDMGHLHKSWYYAEEWRGAYFNYIETILRRVGTHPASFAFQAFNEPGIYGTPGITRMDFEHFKAFSREFITHCRRFTNTYLSSGVINSAHVSPGGLGCAIELWRIYDIVNVHLYGESDNYESFGMQEDRALIDVAVANYLGKPLIVDELGVRWSGTDRRLALEGGIRRWKNKAAALLLWGFQIPAYGFTSGPMSDIGVSDDFGFSSHLPDFKSLVEMYEVNR